MTNTQYERVMAEVFLEFKEWLKDKARERALIKAKGNKIRRETLNNPDFDLTL